MEIESQRIEYPCCICFNIPEDNELKYICRRCMEGVVCYNCSVGMWTYSYGKSCPVCRNKSTIDRPWYQIFDDNGNHINSPISERSISTYESYEVNENSYFAGLCLFFQIIIGFVCLLCFIFWIGLLIAYIFKIGSCSNGCSIMSQGNKIMENILIGSLLIIIIITFPIVLKIFINRCQRYVNPD